MRQRILAATAVVAVALTGCDSGGKPNPSSAPATFSGTDFYAPPDPLPDAAPGTIIWVQAESTSTYRAWRVLYHSRSRTDADVAVSGTVVTPVTAPPSGGYPLLVAGHGFAGIGDGCALSRKAPDAGALGLVQNGYAVATTDYQGLGTPGMHHPGVGVELGRAVLDMARAARRLAPMGKELISGVSQGGLAALWAAQLAPTYAPELPIVGTAAAAPAANLAVLATSLTNSPSSALWAQFMAGYSDSYPNAPLEQALHPDALAKVQALETDCDAGTTAGLGNRSGLVNQNVFEQEPWKTILAENTPGAVRAPAPIFIAQGDADTVVPALATQMLIPRLCGAGDSVELHVYPGANHLSVLASDIVDLSGWIQARMSGAPVTRNDCG